MYPLGTYCLCGTIYCVELLKLVHWSHVMVQWEAERQERENYAATFEFGWTLVLASGK